MAHGLVQSEAGTDACMREEGERARAEHKQDIRLHVGQWGFTLVEL